MPGDQVVVFGGYGTFGVRGLAAAGPAIWIAGGIGITPFLSLLRHIAEGQAAYAGNMTFIWTVREPDDAIYLDEIMALTARTPQIRFHLHVASSDGWLTAERVAVLAGDRLATARILLCGPPAMMHALTDQFVAQGFSAARSSVKSSRCVKHVDYCPASVWKLATDTHEAGNRRRLLHPRESVI